MEEVDVTIIGAGVIGLAIARELATRFASVLVLERNDHYGRETSSRNSEVIHSGIYYPTGSLKARLCVQGAPLLYDYCRQHDIPHQAIGKLIVATGAGEAPAIEQLLTKGQANDVPDLSLLERGQIARLEPAVSGVLALWSPRTGIVNSHLLMERLYREAEARGALFVFQCGVTAIQPDKTGYLITAGADSDLFHSRRVVNAAGLSADRVAQLAGLDPVALGYRLSYCKGSYFAYSGASPVRHLVYPVPHEHLAGLGVHATLDLAGRLRFGPDTEFVDTIDYAVDEGKADHFYQSAVKLVGPLDRSRFHSDMAGIRPKLLGPGVRDFVIQEESCHDRPGLVNLIGMESPGLTSCLAIARHVASLL